MTELHKQILEVLEVELDATIFSGEDSEYYYYTIEDEFFTGEARVEKSIGSELLIEFKEVGETAYRGNGLISLDNLV